MADCLNIRSSKWKIKTVEAAWFLLCELSKCHGSSEATLWKSVWNCVLEKGKRLEESVLRTPPWRKRRRQVNKYMWAEPGHRLKKETFSKTHTLADRQAISWLRKALQIWKETLWEEVCRTATLAQAFYEVHKWRLDIEVTCVFSCS